MNNHTIYTSPVLSGMLNFQLQRRLRLHSLRLHRGCTVVKLPSHRWGIPKFETTRLYVCQTRGKFRTSIKHSIPPCTRKVCFCSQLKYTELEAVFYDKKNRKLQRWGVCRQRWGSQIRGGGAEIPGIPPLPQFNHWGCTLGWTDTPQRWAGVITCPPRG